jgi:hypothetical protein
MTDEDPPRHRANGKLPTAHMGYGPVTVLHRPAAIFSNIFGSSTVTITLNPLVRLAGKLTTVALFLPDDLPTIG